MIVNCFNVKWAAKVQIVFAISAVVALVMIIGIGVYAMATSKGPFTPSECGSESEKYQRTGENDSKNKGETSKEIFAFTFAFARCEHSLNKNAFQQDAYRPLQWPPLDVSTRGGGRGCLPTRGRGCRPTGGVASGWRPAPPYEQTIRCKNITFPCDR